MDEQPTSMDRTDDEEMDEVESDELDEMVDGEVGDTVEDVASAGPSSSLEELVHYVASRLVQNPDDITVESEYRGGTVYVSLRVPEQEMGRVIGREGRTAKAIRTLVSIAGSRQNVHARLDIDG